MDNHSSSSTEPAIVPRAEHNVSRKRISGRALKVLYTLREAGYEAFLVGGGVRDMLLGGQPKDFDIATDAPPEEAAALFRNAHLIGRRFLLVHVRFGREIIEVATFRADPSRQAEAEGHEADAETGMLTRDNVYGTVEEDALRRDFTVNALYYNIDTFAIHDYVGGLSDLQARVVRIIGDPQNRYAEDPVRMLRALRFAAKLEFELAPDTAAPIRQMAPLLGEVPPARRFEEVLKLFMNGDGQKVYALLEDYGLLGYLFPEHAEALAHSEHARPLAQAALASTDSRVNEGKSVTPAFLFAALLWPAACERARALEQQGVPAFPAHQKASHLTLQAQSSATAVPKRFSRPIREIWELQLRLPRRQGKRAETSFQHPRFRAAYDFLLLRETAGEATDGLGDWWTHYQAADQAERRRMVTALGSKGRRRKKRRRQNNATPPASS